MHSRRSHTYHAFSSPASFWRGVTHAGFDHSFLFQPIERRIKGTNGTTLASGALDFRSNRRAIGLFAQSAGRGEDQVFKFTNH